MLQQIRQPVISPKIDRITQQIDQSVTTNDSLYVGNLGKALYYLYLYQHDRDPITRRKGEDALETIFQKLSANQSNLTRHISLSRGLTGLAWCLHILHSEGLTDYDVPTFAQPINRSICRVLPQYIAQNNLDFMHSSVGALAYLTDCLDTYPALEELLEKFVLALEEKLTECEYGRYIQNQYIYQRYRYGDALDVNLGLAHGLCSILLVLLQLHEKGVRTLTTAGLIEQNITFLLNTLKLENLTDPRLSAFPSNIVVNLPKDDERNQLFYAQRMGWCYGDLNQVLLLYRAGIALERKEWIEIADRVGAFTLHKKSYDETRIKDVFLCHGTSGVAQFYKSLYQLSGHQQYQVGYDYWLQQTFERTNSVLSDTDNVAPEFLEGLIGTGLVLMNQEISSSSQWEKLMLLQ